MLLSQYDLALLKPALELVNTINSANVVLSVNVAGNRNLTVDVSEGAIAIKASFPDGAPAYEHYTSAMGLAQAYGLPLAKVLKVR